MAATSLSSALVEAPILGIVRTEEPELGELIVDALVGGGIRAVEISLTSADAVPTFTRSLPRVADAAVLGIGTVRTGADADRAIAAGARFLVSPNLSEDVLSAAQDADIPLVCGVLTPTEIQRAIDHGVEWLKIFPASSFGPRYISELLAPFPGVRFVPTGGLRVSDIPSYRRAGAAALGLAGALASAEQTADFDGDSIGANARAALGAWAGSA